VSRPGRPNVGRRGVLAGLETDKPPGESA